jgi:hypothetical protein
MAFGLSVIRFLCRPSEAPLLSAGPEKAVECCIEHCKSFHPSLWAWGTILKLPRFEKATPANVGCLYAVLHRSEEALKCLRKVVRSGWRKKWLENDPDLSSLRASREFQRLLA